MRIYVETNFVLELALEQTEHAACRRILELADQKTVELALPVFSIYEAHRALLGKKIGIRRVANALSTELEGQLNRTEDFLSLDRSTAELVGALTKSLERAESRLTELSAQLLRAADILMLGALQLQLEKRSTQPDLEFADAMVYASIESDPKLGQGPSCFVTTNSKDFKELKNALASRDCKLLFRFQHALDYVEKRAPP